jgi:hypothetical protein
MGPEYVISKPNIFIPQATPQHCMHTLLCLTPSPHPRREKQIYRTVSQVKKGMWYFAKFVQIQVLYFTKNIMNGIKFVELTSVTFCENLEPAGTT